MVDAPQSARSPQSSQSPRPPRQGSAERRTRESDISVAINLDGTGVCEVATGLPFFDHMLNAFAALPMERSICVCRRRVMLRLMRITQ